MNYKWNYKWQWGTDRVSHMQILFQAPKICMRFPTTSAVLYLTNLAVFTFLNNHSYKRCSYQYTSTKYTQLQSCDKKANI